MTALRFRATIGINGINPYVAVDAARARRLKPGWRRPLPVRVRVNGQPRAAWRVNMMPAGDGAFYLYLAATVRRAAGVGVGDIVRIEVEFDSAYRAGPVDPMPPAFAAALARNARARRAWGILTASRQKEILRYLARLKSPQALARNVERALAVLGGSPRRYMARSWND